MTIFEKDEDGKLVLKAIPESSDSEEFINPRPRSRSNTVLSQMSSNARMRKRSRTDSIASSIMEAVEQIKVHNEQTDVDTKDPGLQSDEYYKKRMTPFRYRVRKALLKYVENETSPLVYIQEHCRNLFFG
ncbi:unnamed protein product [Hanseniaspora opuntiae]